MQDVPSLVFARLTVTDTKQVAAFMQWLVEGEWPDERRERFRTGGDRPFDHDLLVETLWGWDAPRHRMAKLLWQLLQGTRDDETFHRNFTSSMDLLTEDAGRCADVLPPLQDRLRSILSGFQQRLDQDRTIRQGQWGEAWYLLPEQARFFRDQVRRATPDLLEQESDYQESLASHRRYLLEQVVGGLDIPIDDPDRVYVGVREEQEVLVFGTRRVQDRNHRVYIEGAEGRAPIMSARSCLPDDGLQLAWGYMGSGAGVCATSILADAAGGDLRLPDLLPGVLPREDANELRGGERPALRMVSLAEAGVRAPRTLKDAFVREVIDPLPDESFRLSRREVLAWLAEHGADEAVIEESRRALAERRRQYQGALNDLKRRSEAIAALPAGKLRAQRFDLVPPDFESALYVDLMRFLERGGYVLPCARCGLPIGSGDTAHSHRQRGRWESGRPVYHPECVVEQARSRKASWWRRNRSVR